jgi:hypothetical protein
MVKSFCGVNSDGNINWINGESNPYCENDEYKLIDVPSQVECAAGINKGVNFGFSIIKKSEPQYTMFCPRGYCSNLDGSLNITNINNIKNSIIQNVENPFCTL